VLLFKARLSPAFLVRCYFGILYTLFKLGIGIRIKYNDIHFRRLETQQGKTPIPKALRIQLIKTLHSVGLLKQERITLSSLQAGNHLNIEVLKDLLAKPQTPEGKLQYLSMFYAGATTSHLFSLNKKQESKPLLGYMSFLQEEIKMVYHLNPSLQKSWRRSVKWWAQEWISELLKKR
jgi:hypothetical protein